MAAAANKGTQPNKLNGVTVTALAEKVAKPRPCGDPIMDEQKNRARDKFMELLSLLEPNEQHHDQVPTHLRSPLNARAEKTAGQILAEFRAAYPNIARLDKEYIARILVVAAKYTKEEVDQIDEKDPQMGLKHDLEFLSNLEPNDLIPEEVTGWDFLTELLCTKIGNVERVGSHVEAVRANLREFKWFKNGVYELLFRPDGTASHCQHKLTSDSIPVPDELRITGVWNWDNNQSDTKSLLYKGLSKFEPAEHFEDGKGPWTYRPKKGKADKEKLKEMLWAGVLAPVTELAGENKLTYAPQLRALGDEPLLTLAEKARKKRLREAAVDRAEKAKAAKANGGNNIEVLIRQAPRPAVAEPAAQAAAAADPGADADMEGDADLDAGVEGDE